MAQRAGRLSFARLRAQFTKEVLCTLRDPRSRMVVFMPPLLQLLVFAFAATLEVRNVDVAVHNQDAGRWSHELIRRLEGAGFIAQVRSVGSAGALRDLLDRGKAIAALEIPADFSRGLAAGDGGRVLALIDGRRSNSGQIVAGYLSAIAAEVGAEAGAEAAPETAPAAVRHWFNPNLVYRWFTVPGLTGILALFSALLITALSIARERELGTFDQLLVSPTSTPEIIISKSLPALAIGSLLGLLMIAAAAGLFGIPLTGSFGLLAASLVLFILSVVGIGLMISAVSATQQQAILGAFAVGVPSVLMSGFATPVENMPVLLQWLAQGIPLTHFLVIVEGSFLKAMPPGDIFMNLWPLAVIAAVTLTLATMFVRGRLQ
ncbi:MAG TPA: ABC transporter permease [Planctomycetota bacterium]|jgi:ABC-2 type transport system permease protein|nr:ABC transporter permease [Planctomycetota bacterium]OQC21904.1 MAG: Inner membrane transport permease YbhR [Planctomycetes bacterium ADurb.Bin069]HNS00002.1 ABC transporter permease [Planctomycetota bacterium]HNU27394.1 ABC transporter permease [Planctomycetota bacterium]HOE29589.1 ABC transporter permease [Planctomycetota bacterium]